MKNKNDIERMESIKELRKILKETKKDNCGAYRLCFKIERVASSGLSRCLSVYAQKGAYKRNITKLIATINRDTYTKDGLVRVVGCGMDMLFDTCYRLNQSIMLLENYKGKKKTSYNYLVSTHYDVDW